MNETTWPSEPESEPQLSAAEMQNKLPSISHLLELNLELIQAPGHIIHKHKLLVSFFFFSKKKGSYVNIEIHHGELLQASFTNLGSLGLNIPSPHLLSSGNGFYSFYFPLPRFPGCVKGEGCCFCVQLEPL